MDFIPALSETRVVPFTRILRTRKLPMQGEVAVTPGTRLDALDVIARASAPKTRRAVSLTRVLGVREADVPKRLLKRVGDPVELGEYIISKPINLGLQQLVYRSPGAGQIVSIKGSWMVIDLDAAPLDLPALYRGKVAQLLPRFGAEIEAQGALIQCVWGSGRIANGVIKLATKTPRDVLSAEALDVDARGTILVAGAGVSHAALLRAAELHAHGLVVGSLEPGLLALAESLEMVILTTEGFGHIPMSAPFFQWLTKFNGQEAAANGETHARGGSARPELFVPLVAGRFADLSTPVELTPLETKPGAKVRGICAPDLGRLGSISIDQSAKWVRADSGTRFPAIEVEWNDAHGERAAVPWTNVELIG